MIGYCVHLIISPFEEEEQVLLQIHLRNIETHLSYVGP